MHRHQVDVDGICESVTDDGSGAIPQGAVKRDTGQCAHQFGVAKSRTPCFCLAMPKQLPTDAAARVAWMHEKCTNFGAIPPRHQASGVARVMSVAAEERAPITPAATRSQFSVVDRDPIRAVGNQLRIDTEGAVECRFHLFRCVVAAAELACGGANEITQRIALGESCATDPEYGRIRDAVILQDGHLRVTMS